MRNYLFIILFLVLGLTIPAASVYAHQGGDGGGGDGGGGGGGGGDGMIESESTSSDTTNPPSGFIPAAQESTGSEIIPSSETDPGNEEELAELVEEVNILDETAEEGDVEGDSTDSAEETNPDNEEEAAESGEDTNPQEETAEEGNVEGDSTDPDEETTPDNEEEAAESGEDTNPQEETADEGEVGDNSEETTEGATPDKKNPDESTPTEDQGDKKTEVATLVDDIDPNGSADESKTTEQPDPDPGLIGTPGTLPGTRGATLDKITEPEINEDGSVSTWAIYSNDTWVETTVNPDGTHEVAVVLDSGTVIRPGREYIHTGGSLNPALDTIITALEVAAAAGTVAGWVLTVTPAGALASGGVKATAAVWGATTGIQAVRAGADAYGAELEGGASQSEAILAGSGQAVANATVVTLVGKHLEPYQESIGASFGETGKVMTEVGLKQYGNFVADKTTTEITDHSPGYLPF